MSDRDHKAAGELVLRGHVWLLTSLIPLLVRVLPLKALLGLLTPSGRFLPYRGLPARRIAAWVRRRLRRPRHMRRRSCLRQGLALFHFLRLAGVPAVLNVGMYPPGYAGTRTVGHCWITVDGRAVTNRPGAPVAVVLRHGGRRAA